jgi:hypothetical protein
MSALDDLKAYAKKFDLPLIEKEDFEDRIVYIEDWMDVDINGRITHAVLDC